MKVQLQSALRLLLVAVLLFLSMPGEAAPSFQQVGNTLVMSNADVVLKYNLTAGTTDFYWKNSKKISAFYSGVTLSTGYIKGISYHSWSYAVSGSNQAIVTATGSGLPTMKQYFTLDQNDSFLVQVTVSGTNLKANWMGPVVVDSTGWVDLGVTNDNRALVVPFDNDGFVRYNAMPMNNSGTSYEVGAFYDNTSRNGLVVGSVTHDTWKTGIFFVGTNNKLSLMNVFGGATSQWDVMAHGSVTGNVLSSPTMFVGFGSDWRVTMQNFATENTNFAPRLAWTNGVPFGWNSWGVLQENISYTDAIAVSDYFFTHLMNNNFANNGTVYINLDAFWNNNLSNAQLQSLVNHCHAHGQKAGIYWGPFVWFGASTNATNTFVEGTTNTYRYSDVLLRDGNGNFESVDGGLAVDPTHPGTRLMNYYYVNMFTNYGFDYVKLDFLSHGAMEGVHHDPSVTTAIQAYNQGMQYVLNLIAGRMFISESIAPLFPYQYGHSRRIACDAETSRIGDTEYTMNSVTYGWWLNNLYQFNDPDVLVFANGSDTNEAQSRLISGAVTGMLLAGDDLTTTNTQNAAQPFLTNAAINNVARAAQTFTPVEANSGSAAENIFVRQDGATWCFAVFNYTSSAINEIVDLNRAGLPPGNYVVNNLWDGTTLNSTGTLNVSLNAKQSKLFRLSTNTPAALRWSTSDNDGIWDTGNSLNWINVSNSQTTVFHANDQVSFDDTVGAPTNVTVNGTASPGILTVNSSINNYTFGGSGSISGAGSLVKRGSSTLTIVSPANFTGPVTISGGTIYAGDFSFNSVSSVTVTNNATLDFGGSPYNNLFITASGTGVNGQGALYNSYNDDPSEVLNITLSGDTTFGGNNRWDWTGGSISGPHKVTINWSATNGYGEWNSVTIATNVGDIELATGKLGIKNMDATFGSPTSTLIVDAGTELDFWTDDAGYAKNFHVLSGGLMQILSGSTGFSGNLTLENGAQFYAYGGSGSQTMNGTVTLNGVARLQLGDGNTIFANVISGTGGFIRDAFNYLMILQAANTYSGPTVIGGGLTLALTGNGSISHSTPIFFGGSAPTNVSLDVSGRADKTLTLASGQTLGGIGTINGSLIVSAGATLSPSGTNITLGMTEGSSSTGTLTATNAVSLNGTTAIKLNGSGVNDQVQAGAGITYGGTLSLVNISGSPLAVGNSFQVFSATSYSGSFANITPATPGPSLTWDLTQLSGGKLTVAAAPSPPTLTGVLALNGNLILSGSNGVAGTGYYVRSSTNLGISLTNWAVLATNNFDANGAFRLTNNLTPGDTQQFYRIQLR